MCVDPRWTLTATSSFWIPIGELAAAFQFASVVFMGGSLVERGGHNVLEPAWYSKPVVFGPHMENFRDIARLFLDADAAIQIP